MSCNTDMYRYDNGTDQLAEVLIQLGNKTKEARDNANSYQRLFEGKERELKDANAVIQDRRDTINSHAKQLAELRDINWKLKSESKTIKEALQVLRDRVSKVPKKSAMDKDVVKILTMLLKPEELNGCSMPNPAHK